MRNLLVLALVGCTAAEPPHPVSPGPQAQRPERFDERVRQDFFDGIRGDQAALDRAIALCETTLAKQPQHAEAMVWHGAGLMARSTGAFRTGDTAKGLDLYRRGLAEMDHAVELAPNNVGVRIPRGAVLLSVAPYVPEPERSKLLERGTTDYQTTLALQEPYFAHLTLHAREQLLYGLTDGYANLGQLDKARAFYERMQHDAAGSTLLTRARSRAAGEPVAGQTPCEQCHGR
jgi:pentatricopeptide repeat protein